MVAKSHEAGELDLEGKHPPRLRFGCLPPNGLIEGFPVSPIPSIKRPSLLRAPALVEQMKNTLSLDVDTTRFGFECFRASLFSIR